MNAPSMKRTLDARAVEALAGRVEVAQLGARAMPKLTDDFPGMTLGDGYAVQRALLARWRAQGRRQVGWKAGLTSKAKMDQMGVRVPTIGFLLADMARPESSAVRTDELIHPRVECELAFVTKKELAGPDCTRDDVLAATDFVQPAIEIIDSRYAGFKFDLPSVVADNSSSARYVTGGRPCLARDLDLATLGVVLEKNGEPQAIAATAAVMEHPANAVALVVKVLHELGETLPAGSLVLAGGITEAIPVKAGDFVGARFQSLGSVGLRFA
ncbi:MAG TPA: 2-oxo-3-hexenedioate decarboxylase [Burkholderiaceae bacterium]|nr:2-oxo-3-hexenedioate decarboxylase [Burkholderiaceae bacterium]